MESCKIRSGQAIVLKAGALGCVLYSCEIKAVGVECAREVNAKPKRRVSCMQGYLDKDASAPRLDPATCLVLAFPPTPLLRIPPPAEATRPQVNLGQQLSQAPTQSLAAAQRSNGALDVPQNANRGKAAACNSDQPMPLLDSKQLASQGQGLPFSSEFAPSQQQAAPVSKAHTAQAVRQPATAPLQTLFTSKLKGSKGSFGGDAAQIPAALRFYLLADLKQTAESATWLCYLVTCRCTFRGVVQQVMPLAQWSRLLTTAHGWHVQVARSSSMFK